MRARVSDAAPRSRSRQRRRGRASRAARSPRRCRDRRRPARCGRRRSLERASAAARPPRRGAVRAARESPRARSSLLESGPVLAQLGERGRQELRPLRDRRAQAEAGGGSADGEDPCQHADRKETVRVPEQHHEEEHEQDDGKRDAQRSDRGEHRDSRQPRPLLVDLAREDLDAGLHDREESPREISQRIVQTLGAPGFFGHGKALAAADEEPERDSGQHGDSDRLPGICAHVVVGRARLFRHFFTERPELELGRFEALLHLRARCGGCFPRLPDGRAQQRLGVGDDELEIGGELFRGDVVFVHKWPLCREFYRIRYPPMSRSRTARVLSPKERLRALEAVFARFTGPVRRAFRTLWTAPPAIRVLAAAVVVLALWGAANWIVQTVRKPSEMFFPVGGALAKTPLETWRRYGPLFHEHSTAVIAPELLAALAQIEGAGNPVARPRWSWRPSWNPFELYRPASSAVGMFQITDAAFRDAKRYCIHDHAVVKDGP